MLEEYARQVKDRNLLGKITPVPHPAQLQAPKEDLSYAGSEECKSCHTAVYKQWQETPHSRAMDALEKVAKRPGLRHLDAECVVCHTVGFGFKTGYENADKTPALKHVGCESCHGPGSGHAASPRDPTLLKLQSPWKQDAGDKLPDGKVLEAMAKLQPGQQLPVPLTPVQQRVFNGVSRCEMVEPCRSVSQRVGA